MKGPLYDFVEENGVPVFKPKALKNQERIVSADEGRRRIVMDPDFVAYLKVAYGRALRNCWLRDHRGDQRRIDRIFSYAIRTDLKGPPQQSWRSGSDDVRLDYSVHYFESSMPNWKGSSFLLPFAGLAVNESAEYDMLCLHFRFIPKPLVVLWEHEENPYESDVVHFVARDFAEFKSLVFAKKR